MALDRALHRDRAGERVGAPGYDTISASPIVFTSVPPVAAIASRSDREVLAAQVVGRGVADLGRELGRTDEIREQDRDQLGGHLERLRKRRVLRDP